MKQVLKLTTYVFLGAMITVISCQKELSCENCIDGNKPPLAIAGADQTITLPIDSAMLDGSASSDPDGTITSFKWVKIAGPVLADISKADSTKTIVRNLATGVYQFELSVTDNSGLSAKDTVRVMVDALGNQPPVACAGADQIITLPASTVTLNGGCSADPDNNIASHVWTRMEGSTAIIVNPNGVQTQVTGLGQGTYLFELTVTDAGGLSSKDTVQVIVDAAAINYSCGDTNRPIINVQLIPIGTLSEAKSGMAVASVNNKILFAGGGYHFNARISSKVDIYDIITNSWSTAELSYPRFDIAAISAGYKIFFAGGDGSDGSYPVSNVDVYDASTGAWSLMHLSRRDEAIAAATVGNKVMFFGGSYYPNMVDVYDLTSDAWSRTLSAGIFAATAVTANNKVYFGGGNYSAGDNCIKDVPVFEDATNTWSITSLANGRRDIGGVLVNNKIYWAGGSCGSSKFCSVEIQDLNTGSITVQHLSGPGSFWKNGGQNAVLKDNKIIFYRSYFGGPFDPFYANKFDIYDVATNTWSIGKFPLRIEGASIISANNTIYIAGGRVNGVLSDRVWRLEF